MFVVRSVLVPVLVYFIAASVWEEFYLWEVCVASCCLAYILKAFLPEFFASRQTDFGKCHNPTWLGTSCSFALVVFLPLATLFFLRRLCAALLSNIFSDEYPRFQAHTLIKLTSSPPFCRAVNFIKTRVSLTFKLV